MTISKLSTTTGVGPSMPKADFSNTPSGTLSEGGINYKYVTFNSTGSLDITISGFADVLIIGGAGGGQAFGWNRSLFAAGGAGGFLRQTLMLNAGTYTVTVGAGGAAASNGNTSGIGVVAKIGGGQRGFAIGVVCQNSGFGGGGCPGGTTSDAGGGDALYSDGAGAGGTVFGSANRDGRPDNITGATNTYCVGGLGTGSASGAANTGNGGDGPNGTGGSGIVIVRVRTN